MDETPAGGGQAGAHPQAAPLARLVGTRLPPPVDAAAKGEPTRRRHHRPAPPIFRWGTRVEGVLRGTGDRPRTAAAARHLRSEGCSGVIARRSAAGWRTSLS